MENVIESGAESVKEEKEEKAAKKANGTSSLTVFKYQMEISELKEQLEELQGTNKDLEAELKAKNQEIYDVIFIL